MKKTLDYSKFTFFKLNRVVNKGIVERLKKSITKIGYIEARPIIVNSNFEIIDGQNRFVACKDMGIPIVYSILQNSNVPDSVVIAELNKNQLIWRLPDYIHHFSELGVYFHTVVRDFDKTYNLGVSLCIEICGSITGSTAMAIRNGFNIALNPNRDKVAQFVISCDTLFFYKSMPFIRAVKTIFTKANAKQMEKLFKKHLLITHQPSTGAYLVVFTNIINKYNKDNNIIL